MSKDKTVLRDSKRKNDTEGGAPPKKSAMIGSKRFVGESPSQQPSALPSPAAASYITSPSTKVATSSKPLAEGSTPGKGGGLVTQEQQHEQPPLPPQEEDEEKSKMQPIVIVGEIVYNTAEGTITMDDDSASLGRTSLKMATEFVTENGKHAGFSSFLKTVRSKVTMLSGIPELASQQATGKLMFCDKSASRQQALVSEAENGSGSSVSVIAFVALLFACLLLEKAGADKKEILKINGNDPSTFHVTTQTNQKPHSATSAVWCPELRSSIDTSFTHNFREGCGIDRRTSMATAAWTSISQLETSEMTPETASTFALGKETFIRIAVEPNKVIQKAWKNRIQSESKKRKACSRSDEALVMSAPPATRNLLTCAVVI